MLWTTGRLLPAHSAQGFLPEQAGICLCRLGNTGPFGRAPTARTGGGADSAGGPAQLHEPLFGGDAEAGTRTGHEEGTGSRQGTDLPPALCGECLPECGGRLPGLATGGGDAAVGGRVVRHSRTRRPAFRPAAVRGCVVPAAAFHHAAALLALCACRPYAFAQSGGGRW